MTQALSPSEIKEQHQTIASEWQCTIDDKPMITRTFKFKDHSQTMAFVNAVAWVSHQQNHHPELTVGYNTCMITYLTHDVNGLSTKDFACARIIDTWA